MEEQGWHFQWVNLNCGIEICAVNFPFFHHKCADELGNAITEKYKNEWILQINDVNRFEKFEQFWTMFLFLLKLTQNLIVKKKKSYKYLNYEQTFAQYLF